MLKGISLQHAENKIRRDQERDNRRAVQLAVYAARPAQPQAPVVKVPVKTNMNRTKSRAIDIVYESASFKTCDFDEYTGQILPMELVQAAMMEELNCFSETTVWAAADYSEMKPNADATFVRMRWVLCNKRDGKEPDVRARLVACEIAKDKQSQFYASTPPAEAKKLLFRRYAREDPGGQASFSSALSTSRKILQRHAQARQLHVSSERARIA